MMPIKILFLENISISFAFFITYFTVFLNILNGVQKVVKILN